MASLPKMTNSKYEKSIWGLKFRVRVKFKLKNDFETVSSIHPERFGLLYLFLRKIGLH